MKSDMVRPFLEHRHGFAPEVYPHPDLKPVLQETHGVTVFHEQILKTFDVMTGCGLARADEFRRALGNEVLEARVEEFFRKEARARNYSPEVVDKVWGTLKAFGSFGFCKAHGAAFAVPTYQSAWLKAHHPEAFLAGLWEHDPGMYPKRLLVAEARRLGIPILPLDINRSQAEYRVERVGIRAGPGQAGHPAEPERHLRALRRRAETDRGRPALRLPGGPAGPVAAEQAQHPAPGPAGRLRFAAPGVRGSRQPGGPGPAPAETPGPPAPEGRGSH